MLNKQITCDEIDKAIMAHQMWKAQIRKYITDGNRDININELKQDTNCDFGKWLHNLPLESSSDKCITHYSKIKLYHSNFHEVAGNTVELILDDKEYIAKQSIEYGEFLNISTRLILSLLEWKKYISN